MTKAHARPVIPSPDLKPIDRLVELMRILRSPDGCPWDREQTLDSLKQTLVEEVYEVIDAIEHGEPAMLEEELGDLLLQVVFQSQICAEEGQFSFDDVVRQLNEKLVRRHEHVFGERRASSAAEALKSWNRVKATEKEGAEASVVEGMPKHLPALYKAQKLQKKVARVGFDWDLIEDVLAKIEEELGELKEAIREDHAGKIRDEIGDLLFSVVNVSRFLGHQSEEALNGTIDKFSDRFRKLEQQLRQDGKDIEACSLEEMDEVWKQVKTR